VFAVAKQERGVTGERFLQLLETRLDSVIYHLGLTKTRAAARQFVKPRPRAGQRHKVDISSFNVKPGDEVEVKPAASSRQIATRGLEENRLRNVPGWLSLNTENLKATGGPPSRARRDGASINEQLIVEYYSRF